MRQLYAVVATAILLVSCAADPRSAAISSDMTKWDQDLRGVVEKLSTDDRDLLNSYLARGRGGELFAGPGVPPGTTVGSAIDGQRIFIANRSATAVAVTSTVVQAQVEASSTAVIVQAEATQRTAFASATAETREAEARAARQAAEHERELLMSRLDDSITLTVLSKGFVPSNSRLSIYDDYITFPTTVRNSSEMGIKAFRGQLVFLDVLDREIYKINITHDTPLAPGASRNTSWDLKYNQFIDAHVRLRQTAFDRMRAVFTATTILFEDGTRVERPSDVAPLGTATTT